MENQIKLALFQHRYKPLIKFHGYTECFNYDLDKTKLICNSGGAIGSDFFFREILFRKRH